MLIIHGGVLYTETYGKRVTQFDIETGQADERIVAPNNNCDKCGVNSILECIFKSRSKLELPFVGIALCNTR